MSIKQLSVLSFRLHYYTVKHYISDRSEMRSLKTRFVFRRQCGNERPRSKFRSIRRRSCFCLANTARFGRSRSKTKEHMSGKRFWMGALSLSFTFLLICLSINLRSYSEMRSEIDRNTRLGMDVQNLLDETVSLQEEIHALRSDPKLVSKEVEKLGLMKMKY